MNKSIPIIKYDVVITGKAKTALKTNTLYHLDHPLVPSQQTMAKLQQANTKPDTKLTHPIITDQ